MCIRDREIPCSGSNSLIAFPNFENKELEFLSLVPNPANDFIGVQIKASFEADIDIQIFDARGVLVQEVKHQLFEGRNGVDLDISNLSEGMYWVRIPQIPQNHSTKRFVKVRD